MAHFANEAKAVEKVKEICPEVRLDAKLLGGGARFKVRRYALRPHAVNARTGTAYDWDNELVDVRTVIWPASTVTAWRKATCDCAWGQRGGRGCWHVHAVRLEWEKRDAERHAELVADYRAAQAVPA